MPEAAIDRRAATARRLLERMFRSIRSALVFRLWDGTVVRVGPGADPGFAVFFPSPTAFRRCLRHPTPLGFGEAYIDGAIDIEGDLFAAMRAAEALEALRVSIPTRLRALVQALRP